jgi:hypothetical protein
MVRAGDLHRVMKTVAEYRQFAESCRELAARLTDPRDKHAVLLMAASWDTIANQRELALKKGEEPVPGS